MPLKIKEIAKLAGVSPSTVSRTLNNKSYIKEETRLKVMNVINETGYKRNSIAKGLKDHYTRSICLMLPTIQNLAYVPITQGVEDEAREQGYMVILCNTLENPEIEKNYIENMRSMMVDGFISAAITGKHENLTE